LYYFKNDFYQTVEDSNRDFPVFSQTEEESHQSPKKKKKNKFNFQNFQKFETRKPTDCK
jgi:hypothetical protein